MAFITAAESLGLGCCPVIAVRNHIEPVSALLKLPSGVYPFAGLCFGYPTQPGQISIRLPQEIVVHRNHYNDSQLLEHLQNYDQARHPVTAIQPDLKWSQKAAHRLSTRERENFRAFLEQQNFVME